LGARKKKGGGGDRGVTRVLDEKKCPLLREGHGA